MQEVEQHRGPLRRRPVGDQLVKLAGVGAARAVRRVPHVVSELRLAHHGCQPAEHRILVRGDEHRPVRGRVSVARRHVGQDGPGPLPLIARDLPLGQQRLHQREHCLVQGRVHNLPSSGSLPCVQSDERAERGEGPGQLVAERDPGP